MYVRHKIEIALCKPGATTAGHDRTRAHEGRHAGLAIATVDTALWISRPRVALLVTAARCGPSLSESPHTIRATVIHGLLLSDTICVHRKLRQAGVEATLQVFEGQSHAQYYRDVGAPETKEAFDEIARFFDQHIGTK